MKLQITSDAVPLQGTVEQLVKKHLSDDLERVLAHYPDDIKTATVRVTKAARFGYKVSFEMQLPGQKIYSIEKNERLQTAITALRDEVKRQIKRHKEKQTDH